MGAPTGSGWPASTRSLTPSPASTGGTYRLLWPLSHPALASPFSPLLYMCAVAPVGHIQFFATCGLQPTRLLCPWDSPGKNAGIGCHVLLQGIFLTQGLKLGLPYSRQILYHFSHQRSPSYFRLEIYLSIAPFLFLARTHHFSSLADVL